MKGFPQELIDYVIDFFHDDTRALNICSTVCRDWSGSARYHIFEGLKITTLEQITSLSDSSIPFSRIEKLHISVDKPYWERIVTMSAFSRFGRLTHLFLEGMNVASHDLDEGVLPFFDKFPLLHFLSLRACRFLSLHTLMRVVHRLPQLEILDIYGSFWNTKRSPFTPEIPSSSFPVHHINAGGYASITHEFWDVLIEMHPILDLWSFELGLGATDEQHKRVLDSCAHSLRTIDLRALSKSLIHVFCINLSCFL